MRSAHVPVEVLGLQIKRECIGQQGVERLRHGRNAIRFQVGRRIERADFLARFKGTDLGHGLLLWGKACHPGRNSSCRERRRSDNAPEPKALPQFGRSRATPPSLGIGGRGLLLRPQQGFIPVRVFE